MLKLKIDHFNIFFTFAEGYNLIRENPEGLQLIAAILYQDMSGLKPVSLGSDLLLSKGGPKEVMDTKTSVSGTFCRLAYVENLKKT